MDTDKLKILITAFILLVVGVILLGTLADQRSTLDDTTYVANESITAINDTFIALADGNYMQTFHTLRRNNGSYVATTEYALRYDSGTNKGYINISKQAVANSNASVNADPYSFFANYTHYNSAVGLSKNNSSRTLIGLIEILFAIGLLGVGVLVVYANKDILGF